MEITGRCHCGNISFVLKLEPAPEEVGARACSCSFCTKHGGVWTSSPTGSLRVRIHDSERVSRYAFGSRTATFHVCATCGVVPVVTSMIEGREYAVVSVNAFEDVTKVSLQRATATFDGESQSERLARRARGWIPDVEIETGEGAEPDGSWKAST